jgi:hypothetical protein
MRASAPRLAPFIFFSFSFFFFFFFFLAFWKLSLTQHGVSFLSLLFSPFYLAVQSFRHSGGKKQKIEPVAAPNQGAQVAVPLFSLSREIMLIDLMLATTNSNLSSRPSSTHKAL